MTGRGVGAAREFRYDPTLVVEARPYQREAIRAIDAALDARKPVLLHLATGGGKTLVANEIVWSHAERGGRILWTAKDWRLLRQAALDLTRRFKGYLKRVARIGGNTQDLRFLHEGGTRRVYYTTLHTLIRRLPDHLSFLPTLVVWDECHWAEHARTGRRLLQYCLDNGVPVLGLTATPRAPGRSRFRVGYSRTFEELVREGYVAKPRFVDAVKTNCRWQPNLSTDHSDFSGTSLRALGEDGRRNRLIVQYYAKNANRFGKTILFACNVKHANLLAYQLERHGVKAEVVHSHRAPSHNTTALESFRSGDAQVLVNVAMLTHGIDVPDAKSVFLCRPTLSDILFMQMVGRGSRLAPGKSSFALVEFTDNIVRFDKPPITARRFFSGAPFASQSSLVVPAVRLRTTHHKFSPIGEPRWTPETNDVPEAARDLWYLEGQTFGVEIELTKSGYSGVHGRQWTGVAEKLRRRVAQRFPDGVFADRVLTSYHAREKDFRFWNIEPDSSAGWEVTSRILQNQEGLEEIAFVCEALSAAADDLGFVNNHRCGLHVHVGWQCSDDEELKAALRLGKILEPGLATLVAPSRVAHFARRSGTWGYRIEQPNPFTKPISSVFPDRLLNEIHSVDAIVARARADRYSTVNVGALRQLGTVEFRLHSGTLDPAKILLWVSLCQQLLWAASGPGATRLRNPGDRSVIDPSGDIVALARRYLPVDGHSGFLLRLDKRRRQIARNWIIHPELRPWRAHKRRWRRP